MGQTYRTSLASRERNRIHARKTRQRKKEQMNNLQGRAEELKQEQINLKQSINEKNTANILVGLFSSGEKDKSVEDPQVEKLLLRPAEEIPDASKIPELPALILPGQHNSKKLKSSSRPLQIAELPNDGIDYELLGRDRSKCTPKELDQIRRERNRMHAKRTRDRKRLFMEKMADMCKKLEEENELLRSHLKSLGGPVSSPKRKFPSVVSPSLGSTPLPGPACLQSGSNRAVSFDQISTLLEAAVSYDKKCARMSSVASAVSASASEGGSDDETPPTKRARQEENESPVPTMINIAQV